MIKKLNRTPTNQVFFWRGWSFGFASKKTKYKFTFLASFNWKVTQDNPRKLGDFDFQVQNGFRRPNSKRINTGVFRSWSSLRNWQKNNLKQVGHDYYTVRKYRNEGIHLNRYRYEWILLQVAGSRLQTWIIQSLHLFDGQRERNIDPWWRKKVLNWFQTRWLPSNQSDLLMNVTRLSSMISDSFDPALIPVFLLSITRNSMASLSFMQNVM